MYKFAILSFAAVALSAADITVGSAAAVTPGQTLTIPVTLRTQGAQIVALQFNLAWDKTNLAITAENGPAATAAKKAVNLSDTASGAILLILGTNPLDLTPVGDGLLTNLTVKVGANAPPGKYSLTLSAANGSDPTGRSLPIEMVNGSLTLGGSGGGGARTPTNLSLGTLTVPASEAVGISFVVAGDFVASDTIALTVDGVIGVGRINDNSDNQQVNAAGVFTSPDAGGCFLSGESLVPKACVGALLLGNNSIGFFPLFPAGSGPVATSLTLNSVPLSSIFGPDITLPDGTTLLLKVNDKAWDDNTGSFEISPTCGFGLPYSGAAASTFATDASVSLAIGAACNWTATSTVPWIQITNGASGTGSGTIRYAIDASNGPQRNGEIVIASPAVSASARFSISQAAAGTVFSASRRDLSLPVNLAIAAVDVVGTSFVVLADYTAEDTMTVIVSGEASLWPLSADDSQKVNAAGVLTNSNPGGCVTTAAILIPTVCAGALLIGNDKLGFRPIFPANAANGLGSLKPPLVMSLEAQPLSSILGSSFAIPSGTILFLKLNDSLYSDNSGGFRTGPPPAAN